MATFWSILLKNEKLKENMGEQIISPRLEQGFYKKSRKAKIIYIIYRNIIKCKTSNKIF